MKPGRRQFLASAGGLGLLSFVVGGQSMWLTPAQAKARQVPLQYLEPAELELVETLGEQLVPGSRAAGLGHFIDHQLAAPPEQQLLMIRYLGVPQPWGDFYRAGLQAVAAASQHQFERPLTDLDEARLGAFVADLASGEVAGWQGPPAGFFYFVLRADAVDVVWGTQAGFKQLNLPYLAHISPPDGWGG